MSEVKRKAKKHVFTIVSCIVVVSMVAGLLVLDAAKKRGSGKMTVHSAAAAKATINTTLSGTGTLVEEDKTDITVPKGVRLKEFLVKNGETVSDGDALAIVDRVSVMETITETQTELEKLAKKIDSASSSKLSTKMTADVAGRVIKVYARAGDDVQDVMLKYGALAVLSLDGKMAVDLETDALKKDTAVTVVLSSGSKKSGVVSSSLKGRAVITITDEGTVPGDKVEILNAAGDELGEGELYIHNELKVTGYSGTVSAVKVTAGKKVKKNDTLFTLKNINYKAEYENLTRQHREKKETMAELFKLYQSQTVCAPVGGKVSGIDDENTLLLSSNGEAQISLLANAPNGDDITPYTNYFGTVATVGYSSFTMNMCTTSVSVGDYKSVESMDFSTIPMIMSMKYEPQPETPIYKLSGGAWQTSSFSAVAQGDVLLFAYDYLKNLVWVVDIPQKQETPPAEDPEKPGEDPQKPDGDKSGTDIPEEPKPDDGGQQGGNQQGGHGGYGGYGGYSGIISGNWSQYFGSGTAGSQYGNASDYAAAQMPAVEEKDPVIMAVTPGKEMSIDITIDELDILDAQLGQTAEITVDAIPGASFTGVVTDIASEATNSGGNSKYAVTLTMPRTAKMLGGMNASAMIVLEEHANVLSVPVSALVDVGNKTCVYTSYDKKEGLGGLKEVKTGVSDGENVEIVSGLSEGETVWYEYFDMD